ncbi:hypothetical protein OC845_006307 [Tilletia horrida]|nr:hypothetical protein OC845_006307 [Tilletia horrida]
MESISSNIHSHPSALPSPANATPAWQSTPGTPASARRLTLIQRMRQRWGTTLLIFFAAVVVLNMVFGDGGHIGHALFSYKWNAPAFAETSALDKTWSSQPWLNGSLTPLKYDSPFNPDDLTLTEGECDVLFPGLWKDIERAAAYYDSSKHPFTKEYLESSCQDGVFSQLRVVIYHNRLYVKMYHQSDFTRTQTTLALLNQVVSSSRERLPNVEFCLDLQDWGSKGKFSLSRSPDHQDVWLMPDYAYFAWIEHIGGSYKEFREKSEQLENRIGWGGKVSKLFWRGSMKVGRADREAMVAAASGHDWNDVQPLDWTGDRHEWVSMVDHCKYKFHGFAEGNTYSGRIRYLQHCRSVIVTHEPRWIQHNTHLYNANTSSPDQNIVFVPPAHEGTKGTPVKDDDNAPVRYDTTWIRLPEVMDELIRDDAKAKRIADNQWSFFRERYHSSASAACYWRKAIKAFGKIQLYTVDLSGREIAYEELMLKNFPTWPPP